MHHINTIYDNGILAMTINYTFCTFAKTKMKNNHHTVGTIPKFNRIFVYYLSLILYMVELSTNYEKIMPLHGRTAATFIPEVG